MKLTRRQFVKSLGAAGATAAAPLSFSTKASQVDDYKALICIFFDGGNDFFHQVVPMDSEYYGHYAAVRQGIAVKKAQLMPLTCVTKTAFRLACINLWHPLSRCLIVAWLM